MPANATQRQATTGPVVPRPTIPRRRRRTAVLVLGVLLCALGGVTGGWLATQAGHTMTVLAVTRHVPYGSVVSYADLRVARVSSDPGLSLVPASRESTVVGRYAATDLVPGSLLTSNAVTRQRVPGPSEELVGIAVQAKQMPSRPLHANDHVSVVSTPAEDADPTTTTPSSVDATVVDVGRPDDNGIRVVDVRVPAGTGPTLAAQAATGRVALVLESPGS